MHANKIRHTRSHGSAIKLFIIFVGIWPYVGVSDYLFATRLRRSSREIRAAERALEKGIIR